MKFTAELRNELSARLSRVQQALSQERLVSREATTRGAAGGVWMSVDPSRVTPFPSSNRNRGEALPGGLGWRDDSAATFVNRYKQAGVRPFFFWLSPSKWAKEIERDIRAAGMVSFGGAKYPVLARKPAILRPPKTDFLIRRFDRKRDAKRFVDYPDAEMREKLLRPNRIAGLEHFVAWEDELPVAIGRLFVKDKLAYLCGAGTLKSHRGRGAQSALIAARLARAGELGCDWVMSETVTVARQSLSNLQRLGFKIVFWKKVFQSP